jgi:hypothetical protein
MPNEITSVTTVSLSGNRKVTVWRKETGVLKEYDHKEVIGTVVMQTSSTSAKVAEFILNNLPRTVAVEVMESSGMGVRMKKL